MSAGRFTVHYRIVAPDELQARDRARAVALEQTVEVPADLVPAGFIADHVVGRIEHSQPAPPGAWRVAVSYLSDSGGGELPQWLNVVFGNSSLQTGIQVVGIDVDPADLPHALPGPRFGIEGVRERVGRPRGGLLCGVVKPMGLDAAALAKLAYEMALGGVDLIKDDHGLADQPFAPFEARVSACVDAVRRANAATGGSTVFAANVTAPYGKIESRARFAADCGAGALMVMPGLVGFDAMRWLSRHEGVRLPILSHPAFLGGMLAARDGGFSHGVLLGQLQRLSGADICVFPNVGGRFGFSEADCLSIADACRGTAGPLRPALPAPGGGMTLDRIPAIRRMYGDDVVCLLGGSLLREGPAMGDAIRALRRALDAPVG